MSEPIKLPPLTGMLADLPERHKEVIEVYGKACAIAALQSQDRVDAERYRYFRNRRFNFVEDDGVTLLIKEDLDAAIDAAMGKQHD